MISPLDDFTVVENAYHVRIADGGETVGDDDGSPVFHQVVEGFLHESPYATPAGTFPLGVRTESYALGLTPTGGRLHAVYTIEMGGVAVSRNELWLTWNYLN